MNSVLKVKGMSCQHCVMSVTKALNQKVSTERIWKQGPDDLFKRIYFFCFLVLRTFV
jgi:hypothetical protein